MSKQREKAAGGGPGPRELDRALSEEQQPASKAPGGEPELPGPGPGPRRIPTELEMAEGLAAEAAGELPELKEDEDEEANPRGRLLLTDVDMLCNYCEEPPCFKKCWSSKLSEYSCRFLDIISPLPDPWSHCLFHGLAQQSHRRRLAPPSQARRAPPHLKESFNLGAMSECICL